MNHPPDDDAPLGKLAVARGMVTQAQLDECLRLQAASQRTGTPKRLAEVLVERGYVTFEQAWRLLAEQGKRILRCPRCHEQYNLQGAADPASLACRVCGTHLVEAFGPKAPPILPKKLKAKGTWYAGKAEKGGQGVEYLDYQTRLKALARGHARLVVAAALGVAAVLVLAKVMGLFGHRHEPPASRASHADEAASDLPVANRLGVKDAQEVFDQGRFGVALKIAQDALAASPTDDERRALETLSRRIERTLAAIRTMDGLLILHKGVGAEFQRTGAVHVLQAREDGLLIADEPKPDLVAWEKVSPVERLVLARDSKLAEQDPLGTVLLVGKSNDEAIDTLLGRAWGKQADEKALIAALWSERAARRLDADALGLDPAGRLAPKEDLARREQEAAAAKARAEEEELAKRKAAEAEARARADIEARAEAERRAFAIQEGDVEVAISSHQFDRALEMLAALLKQGWSSDLRRRLEVLQGEARQFKHLLEEFIQDANAGQLADPAGVFGTDMRVSGADAAQVSLSRPQAQAAMKWAQLTSAQMYDFLKRMRLEAPRRFELGCFCVLMAPKELGSAGMALFLDLLSRDAKRWKPPIDEAMARMRGMKDVPPGGFVPWHDGLVTVEEHDNLAKGLVLYCGTWMTPEEMHHREKGEYPVKLHNGQVVWVKDEQELLAQGLKKYKGRWYTAEEYALLRTDWEEAFEAETQHYDIHTNVSEAFLAKAQLVLEQAYGLYKEHFGREPKLERKMTFFLFRAREDFEKFCLANKDKHYERQLAAQGFADPSSWFCCAYKVGGDDTMITLCALHEGTHLFYGLAFRNAAPSWYCEGMATNFEQFKWDDKAQKLSINALCTMRAYAAKQGLGAGKLTLEQLLNGDALASINAGGDAGLQFYGAAWAVYYYLHHSGSPDVDKEGKALDDLINSGGFHGGKDESLAVFQKAVPDLTQFEADLKEFLAKVPTGP